MAKQDRVKRTLTYTLEVEAAAGTPQKFFDNLERILKKHAYLEDDVRDADPTDVVEHPGEGIVRVKLVSVKFS